MVFECPALQCVRDKYAALFLHGACTMQHFMWQVDTPVLRTSSRIIGCAGVVHSYPSNQP